MHHFFIWVGLFFVFYFFSSEFFDSTIAYKKALLTVFSVGLFISLNTYYLFPKLYLKQKIYTFWIWNLFLIIAMAMLNFTAFELYFHQYHHSRNILKDTSTLFRISRYLLMYFVIDYIAISILLFFQVKEQALRTKQLEKEKANAELKLLKAQINPHFLFNALNNIYSLSYSQSKKTPESILKLSEMLRYVFYDCSKDKVMLSDEIEYINSFISFQQIKTDYPQNITFLFEAAEIEIAPMILMPFIENSVKYSRIESERDAFVNIEIKLNNGNIDFFIENSIASNPPSQGTEMGLINVESRLELLYPNAYKYDFHKEKDLYSVNLKIFNTKNSSKNNT